MNEQTRKEKKSQKVETPAVILEQHAQHIGIWKEVLRDLFYLGSVHNNLALIRECATLAEIVVTLESLFRLHRVNPAAPKSLERVAQETGITRNGLATRLQAAGVTSTQFRQAPSLLDLLVCSGKLLSGLDHLLKYCKELEPAFNDPTARAEFRNFRGDLSVLVSTMRKHKAASSESSPSVPESAAAKALQKSALRKVPNVTARA